MKSFRRVLVAAALLPLGAQVFAADAAKSPAGAEAVPAARIASVREIGSLLAPGVSSFPVVGQAGNYSAALGGGGSLWFLNNVWTGERKDREEAALWGIVDGAVAFIDSTSPYKAAGAMRYVSDENGWPLPLLSQGLTEYAPVRKFWPRAGIKTAAGWYVYYSLMNNFGPGGGDYFRVGQGIAEAGEPAGPYRQLRSGESDVFWNDVEPSFGSALLNDNDGWLYVYGRYAAEPGKYAVALARVRPDRIGERGSYSYYSLEDAPGAWTGDLAEAAPVMGNMPEEFSVSYNERLKAYLSVFSDPASGETRVVTAPYPWGPWERPETVLGCGEGEYCFGAKEQQAFSAGDGARVYFTVEKKNVPYLYEAVLN